METIELTGRIDSYQGILPKPRFVAEAYAEVIAKLSDRVTSAEMDELVALGALVKERSSQLVPFYEWNEIPIELLGGRPIR
ncbi:hypothetical protein [Comamonas antarctica]|uniref:hypothetical protein n=1 Tax=Comamonas antarctica TaxID=2743470 RepID=UPI0028E6D864|nr:hypothetical protein [Comamonas antarctica]